MRRLAVLVLPAAVGCLSLERETPAVRTYALSVPREAPGRDGAILVRLEVSPRFARRELTYRQTDVLYEADPYHVFLADPAVLLREEIGGWLRRPGDPELRVEIDVEALYGDYRDPSSPRAALALRARAGDADGRPVLDRTYDGSTPLQDLERATLIRGWEAGLRRILEALTADLSRSRPPPAD